MGVPFPFFIYFVYGLIQPFCKVIESFFTYFGDFRMIHYGNRTKEEPAAGINTSHQNALPSKPPTLKTSFQLLSN